MDNSTFEKLYEEYSKNLKEYGGEPPVSKEIYLGTLNRESHILNVSELDDLPDEEYINATYLLILRHICNDKEKARLEKIMSEKGSKDFKEFFARKLLASAEFNGKSILKRNDFSINIQSVKEVSYKELKQRDGRELVAKAYGKVFNRKPSDEEVNMWTSMLQSGRMTKDDFLITIFESEECGLNRTILTDPIPQEIHYETLGRYDDKVFVENAYRWIYCREAERKECDKDLFALRWDQLTKAQIIKKLIESEEGKKIGLRVIDLNRYLPHGTKKYIKKLAVKRNNFFSRHSRNGQEIVLLKKRLDTKDTEIRMANAEHEIIRQEFQNGINNGLAIIAQKEEAFKEYIANAQEEFAVRDKSIIDYRNKLEAENAKQREQIQTLMAELSRMKVELNELKKSGVQAGITDDTAVPEAAPVKKSENSYYSVDYFDFENHFRGSREQIKEVQKIYLPYFEGKDNIVDLGCGRGEFLELLVENNIPVTGVDMYAPFVEYDKMCGLPAVCDDAVHYLREQDKVGGIFMGQVVEHMTVEQIIEIIQIAYEKLEKGGYLIMETPNPMCLYIFSSAFYIDPSHVKPVHPLTLQYLAQKAGFEKVDILFTESSKAEPNIPKLKDGDDDFKAFNNSMRKVNNLLFGSQDYAIIARK